MNRSAAAVLALSAATMLSACAKHDATSNASTPDSTTNANTVSRSIATQPPAASDSAAADSTADADVPVYPGAKPVSGAGMYMNASGILDRKIELTSSDSFDTVDAWYKSHLGSSYELTHLGSGDDEVSQYHKGSLFSPPYHGVSLTVEKDPSTGTRAIRIKLMWKIATKENK